MFLRFLRWFWNAFILIIFVYLLYQNKLVQYGLSQLHGQLSIIYHAQSINVAIQDNSFTNEEQKKMKLIEEIKSFATDSLGMNKNDNYTKVYNQHQKPILLVVSACEPYSFNAYHWSFPFLGNMPYKGFFNFKEARREYSRVRNLGLDAEMYSPAGWSTLGWFNDPIQSEMLHQSCGSLANTILHELTHGTLFVKNDINFNENLASFIGDKGTENFLETKYGKFSKELKDYENKKKDNNVFRDYILKGTETLDSLYKSFTSETTIEEKQKKNIIGNMLLSYIMKPK